MRREAPAAEVVASTLRRPGASGRQPSHQARANQNAPPAHDNIVMARPSRSDLGRKRDAGRVRNPIYLVWHNGCRALET